MSVSWYGIWEEMGYGTEDNLGKRWKVLFGGMIRSLGVI